MKRAFDHIILNQLEYNVLFPELIDQFEGIRANAQDNMKPLDQVSEKQWYERKKRNSFGKTSDHLQE